MNYDVSDLQEIWRKGDGEMPEDLKRLSNAAQDELLLMSLKLSTDVENTLKYNASKSNKTVYEYITSLVLTSLQPA